MIAKACHLLDHRLQAALVSEGARCEMLNCIASGSVSAPAIRVTGERSRLHIQDSQLQNNAQGCLLIEAGGMADVEGCFLEDSRAGPGCKLRGAGTQATLTGCALTGNGGAGLEVGEGARAKLMDCQLGMNNGNASKPPKTARLADPYSIPSRQKEGTPSEGKSVAESADPCSFPIVRQESAPSEAELSSPPAVQGDIVVWGAGSRVMIGDGVEAGLGGLPGSGMVARDGGELVYEESLVPLWRAFSCLLGSSSTVADSLLGSNVDMVQGDSTGGVTTSSILTDVLGSGCDSGVLGGKRKPMSAGNCALSGPDFMRMVAEDT